MFLLSQPTQILEYHVNAYSYAIDKGHPEVLLIPLATNIASSIYELIRPKQNTMSEQSKSLDSKIEE